MVLAMCIWFVPTFADTITDNKIIFKGQVLSVFISCDLSISTFHGF
jgi:hypothetical protein